MLKVYDIKEKRYLDDNDPIKEGMEMCFIINPKIFYEKPKGR